MLRQFQCGRQSDSDLLFFFLSAFKINMCKFANELPGTPACKAAVAIPLHLQQRRARVNITRALQVLRRRGAHVRTHASLCVHVVKRWPHSPSFHSCLLSAPCTCTPRMRAHAHTHTHTLTHRRECERHKSVLILLSVAMNDLPRPISGFVKRVQSQ